MTRYRLSPRYRYVYRDNYIYCRGSDDLRDHAHPERPLTHPGLLSVKGRRLPPPAAFSYVASRASGSAKQGVVAWPSSRFPRTARSPGPRVEARGGQAAQDLQNLPLRPGQRRQSAMGPLYHRPRQVRADGPRRADQDQERDRPDADLPPLVPRRDLRQLRDEHGRHERPRLHDRDRGAEGRSADHPAAAHGRGQGPRPRPHPCLCPICADPAVAEDVEPGAVARAAAVARGPREARWPLRVHPVLLLLDQLPELLVELRQVPRARRSCSRPIAGSPTAATRRRASGSTSWRTRSASIAATRS